MPQTHSLTLAAPMQHLKQLSLIRSLLLFFLWSSFFCGLVFIEFNALLFFVLLAIFSLIHLLTIVRLKNSLSVTETEFFVQLLIDVVSLQILFYCSGGANNPFISYLLVPVCIAAATLPWRLTASITALSLAGYTCLLFFNIEFPLFSLTHESHHRFTWHILGMWFNFFMSAILITYFVVKMADTLRQQQTAISQLREDELRNEQLMAVAILAAGTAHEINTPLSTMSVLLKELQEEYQQDKNLLADLHLLRNQVDQCAAKLKELVNDSTAASQGQFKSQTIRAFCFSVIDRWQLMRPNVQYKVEYKGEDLDKAIRIDPRLDHAIINLLNNAADANPENILIVIQCSNHLLEWQIKDAGTGIPEHDKNFIGNTAYTTKAQGLGLGMVIANATVKHYGGSVIQTDNIPTGTITTLKLPVNT